MDKKNKESVEKFESLGTPSIDTENIVKKDSRIDFSKFINLENKFSSVNRLITRDLNSNRGSSPKIYKYTKEQISQYLQNPISNEKQLREAVTYLYGASSHFRRLIQYFVSLTDLSYVISPIKIDPKSTNVKSVNRNYRKVLDLMTAMSVRTQFPKILTVCFREDTFFGTIWETKDNITIQQLPPDYCKISVIEGNVPNVTFDFSYFDINPDIINFYPEEFAVKYREYKNNGGSMSKWIELDSPTSFAIKCNNDMPNYSVPPFSGILREIYDIEDYKELKLTKTAIDNYAMLVMTLGIDKDGNWAMDLDRAKDFYRNLEGVLPDEIGSVLSPMPINKISFEKNNNGDSDTIAEAEQNLFTAAGVSSLIFNNEKASANALLLSIKADQAMTFGIVKSIEDMVNRFIQSKSYGKNFKITFLDCSPYNRKEMGDQFIKACQLGMPMVSFYCASQGLGQSELDSMNFLENTVLGLKELLIPLKSSSTRSSADAMNEGGAPKKDAGDLTDSGESSRENE